MENGKRNSGVGFCGLLTIAFIVLRLCDVINWSWAWVLAPAWIPIALIALALLGAIFVGVAKGIVKGLKIREERGARDVHR